VDRRTFLVNTGAGLGLAGIAPLTGCAAFRGLGGESEFDPGPYTVGRDHLVFDDDGSAIRLDVAQHSVQSLDTSRTLARQGADAGEVNHPVDACVAPDDRLFVLDRGNGRVHVFEEDGDRVHTFGATGSGPDELAMPRDIAAHGDRVYVCDTLNHRVQVYNDTGALVQSIGRTSLDELNGPRGLAVVPDGELHVLEAGTSSVKVFSPDGRPERTYGEFGEEPGQLLMPRSIAIDAAGRVFVADPAGGRIHVFRTSGEFLGRFRPRDSDGDPVTPLRVSLKPNGELYVWTDGLEAFAAES